jgi:hypothetical protein
MSFYGMWRDVGLVRADVLEKLIASICGVEKIRERRKTLAVGQQTVSLPTSVLTRPTLRDTPENSFLHCQGHENLKFNNRLS